MSLGTIFSLKVHSLHSYSKKRTHGQTDRHTHIMFFFHYIYIYNWYWILCLSFGNRSYVSTDITIPLVYYIIYIYIYIYILLSTDSFVVSQLFIMAKHVGHLKLGSKPAQLYVRLSIRPLGQQSYHVAKGIIRYYVATAAAAFVRLHFIPYRIPECSIRSKSFALCERQPKIPSPECSTPIGECIYCHPQTDCFDIY